MEEVMSIEFPIKVTTSEGEVLQIMPQISLTRGLERSFNFSAGNEEGRRITEEYINYTFAYYAARKEREETSESEDPERWKEAKKQEDINIDLIKQYQSSDTIIQFSNTARDREKKKKIEDQKKALKEALEDINTIPVTSPSRENLQITAPPITEASNDYQFGTPGTFNNPARIDLFNK